MQSDGAAGIIIAAASRAGKFTNQGEVEDHASFAAKSSMLEVIQIKPSASKHHVRRPDQEPCIPVQRSTRQDTLAQSHRIHST